MKRFRLISVVAVLFGLAAQAVCQNEPLVFEPKAGASNGKHVVFISGDEEYRSEESCAMLAKILSQRHGFQCTVLFAIDQETGYVNPNEGANIPHTEALATADLMIIGTRRRKLPGYQLQPILDYLNEAKPIIAFRTATHAFDNDDRYGGYDWQNFGKTVVGDNWVNHHGRHKVQGGRAVLVEQNADHPILNGVADIFTPSDIYGIRHLDTKKSTVLLRGAVTETLDPSSMLVEGEKNNPMMPLAWLKSYPSPSGERKGLCFATTAGSSVDFRWEDLRRLIVNAAFHLTGMVVPSRANAEPVDPFEPSFYGFQKKDYFLRRGLRASDFKLGSSPKVILSETEIRQLLERERAHPGRLPPPERSERIVLLGNGLAERMIAYGFFETELQLRFPDRQLVIRNMARPAWTPSFRPHPARHSQWAFPGAEKLRPEFSIHSGAGHFPSPDEWLETLRADTILAFFGFNESFDGPDGLEKYRAELEAFVRHTLAQKYNGESAPRLALVSPIAFQNLSAQFDLLNGHRENANLALYSGVTQEVAANYGLPFADLFSLTTEWFGQTTERLTVNGAHLNEDGYRKLAPALAAALYGPKLEDPPSKALWQKVHQAVNDKNWFWFNDYQMLNGVHSYGRRWKPFGNVNYPEEIEKLRQLTAIRDRAIGAALQGETIDLIAADKTTRSLTPIPTNAESRRQNRYQYGEDALAHFTMADGYKMELFASESEFPELANPVQLSFDNRGRLWVSTMPSYPHFRPGDPRPNDKLLILEDTDADGKADKCAVYADKLHVPVGFELAPEGVYVSQPPNLILLRDTDGDGRADSREIMLTGFDSHDTHHAASAFCADPSGAFFMCEGLFHHTNVESAHGAVRAAAVRALRYNWRDFDDHANLLLHAASDDHGRVRLEAIIAASRLDNYHGLRILEEAGKKPIDRWIKHAYETAKTNLSGKTSQPSATTNQPANDAPIHLSTADKVLWNQGAKIYQRDGHCITCHQADGNGLPAAGFPPLSQTDWVNGNPERLIKLTLNGLHGPIEVRGKKYPGFVPMTQFRELLDDHEIAAVLTYVRNAFGNRAPAITSAEVKTVRQATQTKAGFWTPQELQQQHPN